MISPKATLALALLLLVVGICAPVRAVPGKMSSDGKHMRKPQTPADSTLVRKAYTTDHEFLIELLSVPQPIPFERYFNLQLAVYDGKNPQRLITNAQIKIFAGMRHELKHGFAHGMQSSPRILENNGAFSVSGMYFHMMGQWTLKVTVTEGNKEGTAWFQLPCCGP
jgi:hypothetical protein